MRKLVWIGALLSMLFIVASQPLFAEAEGKEGVSIEKKEKSESSLGFKAIAAALAVGLSALASGLAQARIGAAAAGALAEKPELVGSVIILEAIPETMIILGFVVAVLIIFVL